MDRLREVRSTLGLQMEQPEAGREADMDRPFSFTLQTFVSSLTFAFFFFLYYLHFGTILLLLSSFEKLAGNHLHPGTEVCWSQRSPRTIHQRWKETHTKGVPPTSTDICDLHLKPHVASCFHWADKARGSRVGEGREVRRGRRTVASEKSLEGGGGDGRLLANSTISHKPASGLLN